MGKYPDGKQGEIFVGPSTKSKEKPSRDKNYAGFIIYDKGTWPGTGDAEIFPGLAVIMDTDKAKMWFDKDQLGELTG